MRYPNLQIYIQQTLLLLCNIIRIFCSIHLSTQQPEPTFYENNINEGEMREREKRKVVEM
jgi:hypothetical protein